jgi:hypothetical protein
MLKIAARELLGEPVTVENLLEDFLAIKVSKSLHKN